MEFLIDLKIMILKIINFKIKENYKISFKEFITQVHFKFLKINKFI